MDIAGHWSITAWVQEYDDGRRVHPVGEHPHGYVSYGPDGRMSTMVSAADRPRFTTGGQWTADDAEVVAAYRSFLGYAGRWRLDGDRVVHSVEISLFPDWVGTDMVRQVRLRGDELDLLARLEDGTPEARTARLSWRRS